MRVFYASSYFESCVAPIANNFPLRSRFAPLKVSIVDGADLLLLPHFFYGCEYPAEDDEEEPTDIT